MKNKTLLTIILAIIILGVGAVLILTYKDSILKESVKTENETKSQQLVIEDKTITDDTKPFKIDIIYPYVAGSPEFNQKVDSIINEELNNFKTNSLENDNAVKEIDPKSYAEYPRQYDFYVKYEKGQVDENIISAVLEVYSFTGGAHGATNFIPTNYSPKDNKEIKLADIFSGQEDYVKKISDFCIKNLTEQITAGAGSTEGTWIEDGAGPKEENFSVFLINQNSITFYFPQYQVAPYALGDFKVIMPK
jgi:hypothetical protein